MAQTIAVLCATLLAALSTSPEEITTGPSSGPAEDEPTVVCVEVTGRDGAPVLGLGSSDFRVRVDRKPVEAVSLERRRPLSVVLLLEVSYRAIPYQQDLRRAADAFAALLEPQDELAVTVFGSSVARLFPFSDDHLETRRKILSHHFQATGPGQAKLYDGLARAVEMLATRSGRRVVVAFSQGIDLGSTRPRREVFEAARRGGVRLEIAHLPRPPRLSGNWWRQQLGEIREGVVPTGGRLWRVEDGATLRKAYRSLALQLTSGYCLALPTPPDAARGGSRRLQVRVQRRDTILRAPEQIVSTP